MVVIVRGESRHASMGSLSVAWVTETGPRVENQDRAAVHIGSDGSWLVAVADGMGGQPRGREAAIVAIRGLPRRMSTPVELKDGFAAANDQVARLTPGHLRYTMSDFHLCPAATLCAAAWTPTGGVLVGYAGDTLPVVLWNDDGSPADTPLGPMMAIMAWREGDIESMIDDALRDGPAIVGEIAAEVAEERGLPRDWLKQLGHILVEPPADDQA